MRVCARLRVCVFDHLCRGGVVDLQLRDPSLGLCGLFEQHFLFTVNESLNSSKALVTLEFLARRSYVGLPNPLSFSRCVLVAEEVVTQLPPRAAGQ